MIRLDKGEVEINGATNQIAAELACFFMVAVRNEELMATLSMGFSDIFCDMSPASSVEKRMLKELVCFAYETSVNKTDAETLAN